jgi:hypothetical protein
MANIITAGNGSNSGTSISSDTSGILEIKTGSGPTTALTISASQVATFAQPPVWSGGTPQVTVYTSGSDTYTTPAGAKWLTVRMVGGGGGGSGSGSSGGGTGGTGGNTTFGTSLLTCNGGSGSAWGGSGGSGGSATITGPSGFTLAGNAGGGVSYLELSAAQLPGATGGISPFGGPGIGRGNSAGVVASGYGSGGSGGGIAQNSTQATGSGGGSGGYLEATITTILSTYSYAVGTGGAGGTAGSGGYAGGAGAAGIIIVTAYF